MRTWPNILRTRFHAPLTIVPVCSIRSSSPRTARASRQRTGVALPRTDALRVVETLLWLYFVLTSNRSARPSQSPGDSSPYEMGATGRLLPRRRRDQSPDQSEQASRTQRSGWPRSSLPFAAQRCGLTRRCRTGSSSPTSAPRSRNINSASCLNITPHRSLASTWNRPAKQNGVLPAHKSPQIQRRRS